MRKNDRLRKILITAALCPALVLGMAACGQTGGSAGSGSAAAGEVSTAKKESADEKAEEVVFKPPVDTPFVTPGEKDESVYVKADAAGTPTEKTVEVVLKKIEGTDPIEDRSNLHEIKNTEGNEEYTEAGEGRYLWQNNGADIHYKGKSDEALPVNVRITYYLEGEEVSPEQIAGKTGKVKIRFDYENSTDVPFMVLSSAMLPADVFSDVEVTNGKVMDLGDQKAVIGFAFPGLMDTLKLVDYEPTEEIELPEYVEIEARAEEFALDFTATVVSTGLFEDLEDGDLEDLDKLPEDMDELTDASSEIRDAAREMADGGSELGDYLCQYFDGLAQLSEGTDSLDQGLALLNENVSKIAEGSKSLQGGLEQIDQSLAEIDLSSLSSPESREAAEAARAALESIGQSSAELKETLGKIGTGLEAVRVFAGDAAAYKEKVDALRQAVKDNPAPELTAMNEEKGWSKALNEEAGAQAAQALEKTREAAQTAASEAVDTAAENAAKATAADAREAAARSVEESGALDDLELTDEQKQAVKEQLISEIRNSISENTGEKPEVTVDAEDVEIALDETFGEIEKQIQEDANTRQSAVAEASEMILELQIPDLEAVSPEQLEQITKTIGGMEQSLAVVGAYAEGMSQTASAMTELSGALTQLKAGVSQLSQGSAELSEGLGVFEEALSAASEGADQLASAMNQVTSAGGELGSAYWQLVEGMNEFADGIAEFDEEGIQSLAELAGPEYKDVIRGVRAARDAEHSYTNFSGICDGQKGSVRFIIETEEISRDK